MFDLSKDRYLEGLIITLVAAGSTFAVLFSIVLTVVVVGLIQHP